MACMIMVLPALDGETIRPRWPLPTGQTMSMIRPVRLAGVVSICSRSCGYSGVSLPNSGRFFAFSGSPPLMVSIRTSGLNFSLRSPSLVARMTPVTTSPLRRPSFLTIESETYASSGPGQVAGGPHEGVVVEHVEDAAGGTRTSSSRDRRLGLVAVDRAAGAPGRPRRL